MPPLLASLSLGGCTTARLGNAPLAHWKPAGVTSTLGARQRSDELLLIMAFSGGGTRAAAGLEWAVLGGYEALDQDYASGSGALRFQWDTTMHGPVVGLSLRF